MGTRGSLTRREFGDDGDSRSAWAATDHSQRRIEQLQPSRTWTDADGNESAANVTADNKSKVLRGWVPALTASYAGL